MRPLTPTTKKGRTQARDDIHHRTADQGRPSAIAAAKRGRHGARQEGRKLAREQQP